MDNQWIEKILKETIDATKSLNGRIPSNEEVAKSIFLFIENNYEEGSFAESLRAFHDVFNSIAKGIELNYPQAIERNNAPFFNGVLQKKLKRDITTTKDPIIEKSLDRGIDDIEEKLLTTSEIASICRCKEQTVTGWIRKGKLKGDKIGKHYLVKESDFIEYKNS